MRRGGARATSVSMIKTGPSLIQGNLGTTKQHSQRAGELWFSLMRGLETTASKDTFCVSAFVQNPRAVHDQNVATQGSAKRWTPGCVNAAGKARQKWQARAGTKFTKPGDGLSSEQAA